MLALGDDDADVLMVFVGDVFAGVGSIPMPKRFGT